MTDGLTIAVAGMTGAGKTSWVRRSMASEPRLLLIDPRNEHSWLPEWTHEDGATLGHFLADLEKRGGENGLEPFQIRLVPPPQEELARTWVEYAGRAAYMLGNITVVLEEADLYSTPNGENHGVRVCHNYGRNRGVSLVYCVRVVNSVNRLLTTNTKGWMLFRLQEPHYLESLDARFEFDVVSEVSRLNDFEFIRVNPDRSWMRGRVEP